MRRKRSKVNEQLKKEYIERMRKLTPEEKIRQMQERMKFMRALFEAGLSSKGFSKEQIDEMWKKGHKR